MAKAKKAATKAAPKRSRKKKHDPNQGLLFSNRDAMKPGKSVATKERVAPGKTDIKPGDAKKQRTKKDTREIDIKALAQEMPEEMEQEAPGPRGKKKKRRTAEDMAKKQRDISISEFFRKNRHLLGFDNPTKALLTTVKEAVDNALDACEEARILPEIIVKIDKLADDRYSVEVTDNGPGIVKSQIPKIFGKLLYGSKFHSFKMSRGQQGIGISAAGMYGQMTTGRPTIVTSRTQSSKNWAHYYEIQIDAKKNMPKIIRDDVVEWDQDHGTLVKIEMEARYLRGARSVLDYLKQTAIANPHVKIDYYPPNGEDDFEFMRATDQLPVEPKEIKPHPHGVELGVLIEKMQASKTRNLSSFFKSEFSRVTSRVTAEICEKAGIPETRKPSRLKRADIEKIFRAIQEVKIISPPASCISPIGEDLILAGLKKEIEADFYVTTTRPPRVYRGNPFQIEAGLAYGGKLPEEGLARILRFANRVPLLYQQSACAIYKSVLNTDWRNYRVSQSRGALPGGPLVIFVHMASVWVPFTSESKEAVAHYPEIMKEIRLALQECGRRLGLYLARRRREAEEKRKHDHINLYIPFIGEALQDIIGFSEKEKDKTIEKLRGILERSRKP